MGFDSTPFTDVKAFFENQIDANIVLTTSATDGLLAEEEPFTSQLTGISDADALRFILLEKNATYCIQNGVVKIISLDDEYEPFYFARRMIDVSEILQKIHSQEKNGSRKSLRMRPD